jgi:hypothetical protein
VTARREKSLRRLGLDEDQAEDVIYPVLLQFLSTDVALLPPSPERVFRWLDRTCHNAAIDHLRTTRPMLRLDRRHEAYMVTEDVSDDMFEDPTEPTCAEGDDELLDAPWLAAIMPRNVSRAHWRQAVAQLRPSERFLFKALSRRVRIDRAESDDPRAFDAKPFRLAATRVAQDLGRTANSVSAQWNVIRKKLHRTVSVLRVQELHAQGQSLATIRAALRTLKWSDADADSLITELDLGSSSRSGGAR